VQIKASYDFSKQRECQYGLHSAVAARECLDLYYTTKVQPEVELTKAQFIKECMSLKHASTITLDLDSAMRAYLRKIMKDLK
jgi:hypothetical protein